MTTVDQLDYFYREIWIGNRVEEVPGGYQLAGAGAGPRRIVETQATLP
jgi:hypothetical protein